MTLDRYRQMAISRRRGYRGPYSRVCAFNVWRFWILRTKSGAAPAGILFSRVADRDWRNW